MSIYLRFMEHIELGSSVIILHLTTIQPVYHFYYTHFTVYLYKQPLTIICVICLGHAYIIRVKRLFNTIRYVLKEFAEISQLNS